MTFIETAMPTDSAGDWYPDLSPKQLVVYNSHARALLASGPRLSSKTWATTHRIIRHMVETNGARVAMFSKTLKNSNDGGTWSLLHRFILKEWIQNKITRYTTLSQSGVPGPKVNGLTRTPFFRIKNVHGGESELMLFSLDYDHDIEDKLKEMQFSMIYFAELDKFRDRKILSVSLPSLRMPNLKFEDQMWMSDTNPSDEGEQSWIYQVWYFERTATYEQYHTFYKKQGLEPLAESEFLAFQKGLQLVEFTPEDNPWLDARQVQEIKTIYAYDRGLYERYVNGKWVFGDGDASIHFRGFFKRNLHVVGNCESLDESQWTMALPTDQCFELITGWDLGDTNHAIGIMEKTLVNDRSCFTVLDETVSIKQQVSYDEITETVMNQIAELERLAGHKLSLERSWSDHSSIEKFSAGSATMPYLQVYAASDNRIFLRGVPKPKGSVRMRVKLLKQLISQGRFKVSAHCTFTIKMLEQLKRGQTELTFVVPDENKHIFDAITYALLMECAEELEQGPSIGKRKAFEPSVIQI